MESERGESIRSSAIFSTGPVHDAGISGTADKRLHLITFSLPMTSSKSNWVIRVRRYAILLHRWLGVGFCVLFAVWFVSGIVMMYWPYPKVSREMLLAK